MSFLRIIFLAFIPLYCYARPNFKTEKKIEITIPLYMWHNRWTYEKPYIDEFNEIPLGLGAGAFFFQKNKNVSLNCTICLDSYKKLELYWGVFIKKIFYLTENKNYKISFGTTFGFTQRKNLLNYMPLFIPPYPFFGIGYKKISLEFTYLLGAKNFGNIFLVWMHYLV